MNDRAVIQLELKYCERCGGLWLRPKGSDVVFCRSCASVIGGMLGGRGPGPSGIDSHAETGSYGAFWSEGGNA